MNLLELYFNPQKYFLAIKEKRYWLLPLVILVVASLILTVVILTSGSLETRLAQLRERNLTPEQLEQAEKMLKGPLPLISGIIGTIIFVPLTILIVALILNFLLTILGITGQYLLTFAVTVNAALVRLPSILIRMVVTLITKNPVVETSFALFVPFINRNSFVYRLLTKFDFFTIWEIILIALGLKIVYELKDKKIYYLIIALWVIYIIVTSFFGPKGATRT
ncbi:MAG: YIP1 family protein [candidate division WOR-3 bacterium]|nr:YIP1 family protein [candidate division WOR-3 bacterium]MCX7757282.1 YIP1 family protein [candidate division WOR-3 bacterium]MDW7988107.1 YIP1 family protein [candidate division WOR-3 bacterium]